MTYLTHLFEAIAAWIVSLFLDVCRYISLCQEYGLVSCLQKAFFISINSKIKEHGRNRFVLVPAMAKKGYKIGCHS